MTLTPANSIPRVIRDGQTVAEIDPEAGLAPLFGDAEALRMFRIVVVDSSPAAMAMDVQCGLK